RRELPGSQRSARSRPPVRISNALDQPRGPERRLLSAARYCAAMSQENVEIARAWYEKASTTGRLEAVFENLSPEVEFHLSGAFPDLDAVYRGHGGHRKLNEEL